MCVDGITQQSAPFYSAVLQKMMKNLHDQPTLRRQYYGSEGGYVIGYPAVSSASNNNDPRLTWVELHVPFN
jgi:hypothetical protein